MLVNRAVYFTKYVRLAGLALTFLLFSACTPKDTTPSAQVVARVNGVEISIHQLNALASNSQTNADSARQLQIDRLVERELAVQQALALQLERRPEVMMRLEEARRNVLAAAWADHLAQKAIAPDENLAARYFAEHPGLFAQRKLYRLREISLPVQAMPPGIFEAHVQQKSDLREIMRWLKTENVKFTDQTIIRLSEQLPIEVADRLYQAKPGDVAAFRSTHTLVLYEVLWLESIPVDWRTAEPVIKTYLVTQTRNQLWEQEIKRQRALSKIEYLPSTNKTGTSR